MKKISNSFISFIFLLGVFAIITLPVYLIIATGVMKESLPYWYFIINIVLSGLSLLFIVMLFLASIFDKKE